MVIDSDSDDSTRERIKKYYPRTEIIRGTKDWWWTRAMYEGVIKVLKQAQKGDFILEMNNDCFPVSGYLASLIQTAKKHPRCLIGSVSVRAQKPSQVVEAGIRFDWKNGRVYTLPEEAKTKILITCLDALPGKGTLIPLEVFGKIGNFDKDKFPHYIADYEFSHRAKMNGFDLLVDTNAILKHYWEATGIYSRGSSETYSPGRAWKILIGRKSMNNITDWLKFLGVACPKEYLLTNYWLLFKKLIKGGMAVRFK